MVHPISAMGPMFHTKVAIDRMVHAVSAMDRHRLTAIPLQGSDETCLQGMGGTGPCLRNAAIASKCGAGHSWQPNAVAK
jgi:hypothetical protein